MFLFDRDTNILVYLTRFYSLFKILSWSVNIMHLVLLRTISTCTLLINAYVKQHKYILHGYVASGLISSPFSYSPIKRLTPVFQFMWLIPCIAHKFKKNPRKLIQFHDPNIKQYSFIVCIQIRIMISHIPNHIVHSIPVCRWVHQVWALNLCSDTICSVPLSPWCQYVRKKKAKIFVFIYYKKEQPANSTLYQRFYIQCVNHVHGNNHLRIIYNMSSSWCPR